MIRKDCAVSPVVGVLLMLVVTIIIAAVVSGFAGGLAGSQEKAPQASFEVKAGSQDGQLEISFEHLGGDPILTKDCEFITFLPHPNGTVVKHVQTPSSPLGRGNTNPVAMYSRGPHLTDPQKYAYPCNPIGADVTLGTGWVLSGTDTLGTAENPAWFGKAVWLPGDVARTYHTNMTANILGLVSNPQPGTDAEYSAATAILNDAYTKNSNVEIKLLHKPSEKYILDKKIVLRK